MLKNKKNESIILLKVKESQKQKRGDYMRVSDIIEEFIKELFDEENEIEIQRNDLAQKFNCVPSQINYVISTRFKPSWRTHYYKKS